jgi:DNA-binding PadR family transcriptional regulator
MTAVFSHGRLRLYLLKLLDDGPKHGYELIRSLENRFLGLYAPSAGTIYPRLSRLEAEGLVRHTATGGRKVYEITDAGRAELRQRSDELAELESDIRASVADLSGLATEIQQQVRGSVRDLKRELREATRRTRAADWWRTPAQEPDSDPYSDPAAELDRRLGEFVAEVRGVVRAARSGGVDPVRVADVVDSALRDALTALRRLLP